VSRSVAWAAKSSFRNGQDGNPPSAGLTAKVTLERSIFEESSVLRAADAFARLQRREASTLAMDIETLPSAIRRRENIFKIGGGARQRVMPNARADRPQSIAGRKERIRCLGQCLVRAILGQLRPPHGPPTPRAKPRSRPPMTAPRNLSNPPLLRHPSLPVEREAKPCSSRHATKRSVQSEQADVMNWNRWTPSIGTGAPSVNGRIKQRRLRSSSQWQYCCGSLRQTLLSLCCRSNLTHSRRQKFYHNVAELGA